MRRGRRRRAKPATSSSSIRRIARARRPRAITALAGAGWMTPGCVVTVELAHNEDMVAPDGFEAIDERRYGAAKIVILKRTS